MPTGKKMFKEMDEIKDKFFKESDEFIKKYKNKKVLSATILLSGGELLTGKEAVNWVESLRLG